MARRERLLDVVVGDVLGVRSGPHAILMAPEELADLVLQALQVVARAARGVEGASLPERLDGHHEPLADLLLGHRPSFEGGRPTGPAAWGTDPRRSAQRGTRRGLR